MSWNAPDSRLFTRCSMVSTLAASRQTTMFEAETTSRQSSSSARSSIARASKTRDTPREAYVFTDRPKIAVHHSVVTSPRGEMGQSERVQVDPRVDDVAQCKNVRSFG